MPIKQSLCYPLFKANGVSMADFCKQAKEIGYAAVEFWKRSDDTDECVSCAKEVGLTVASMIGHMSLPDGLNKVENHDRIEAELRENIDYAAAEGIPNLICFSGNRNDGQSDYEGMIACAKGLRRVAGYAEEKGINLNVELLNSKVDHPGYQCDRTDWGMALCEMVGSPRVKLLFDIYHMQIMEGDVIRSLRKAAPYIGHYHTAGNPDRKDLDDEQEMNYRGICRAIAATGYEGYVGHEFSPKGDQAESMRKTFKLCHV